MLNLLSKRPLAFWLTASLLSLTTFGIAADRGLPAQEGIVNFGQVNQTIYRGAEPDATAVKNLQRLGVKTIIDLRLPNEGLQGEPVQAQAHGILYTNVPLRGLGRPTDEQVRQVLGLIETLPGPVFIHCKHGCDRTGTIIACYRIQHDQWSSANALKEAARYGISWFERGMRNYVLSFGKARTTIDVASLRAR